LKSSLGLALFASSFLAFVGSASAQKLVVDRGSLALPNEEVERDFVVFLKERRAHLLKQNPHLLFRESFATFGEMFEGIDSRRSKFANREHHCRFLERLAKSLDKATDRVELAVLLQNGKICVPGDLAPDQQEAWSLVMQKFLWQKPWIPHAGKRLAAHEYVVAILGDESLPQAEVAAWRTASWDATYAVLSPADKDFARKNGAVGKVVEAFATFDIDEPTALAAGKDVKKYAAEEPGLVGDVFAAKPTIWMSPAIGPADAVDTLFHEYGHIVFDWYRGNFRQDGERFFYKKDRLQDETCAESFSWLLLRGLYADYPEIEFSHVYKFYGFEQLRRNDPHYAGAAAVFRSFKGEGALTPFRRLLKAEDLGAFLSSEALAGMTVDGKPSLRVIDLSTRE